MSKRKFAGTMAHPYLDIFLITIDRFDLDTNYGIPTIVRKTYRFKYNDHIETVLKRFSKLIELHHINVVKEIRNKSLSANSKTSTA